MKAETMRDYNNAVPSLPVATKFLHSPLHRLIFALSFLSASILSIHDRRASSSSGTKKEDRRDSTVSKLAAPDVILSVQAQ